MRKPPAAPKLAVMTGEMARSAAITAPVAQASALEVVGVASVGKAAAHPIAVSIGISRLIRTG